MGYKKKIILCKMIVLRRIVFTISLFSFTLMLLFMNVEKSQKSHKNLRQIKVNLSTLYIDNILNVEGKIVKDKSIFFVDTTRMKSYKKIKDLTLRQACSIESAALSNLNAKIFVILVSPSEAISEVNFSPSLEAILEYPNVYVTSMNLLEFSIDTSYEEFVREGSLIKSKFTKQHTSDFIRLLLLIKYGGTYIDSDMIVMENLGKLPSDCICRDHGYLNAAIMKSTKGSKITKLFIENMIDNFNGTAWGWNGPIMLSRVLNELCGTKNVDKMNDCYGFQILDENICYPVSGLVWEKLFDEDIAEEILDSVKTSFVVHFWNKLSKDRKLSCNSSAAYTQLARKFCPKTFQLCHDYF